MKLENPFYHKGVNPTVDLMVLNPLNQILLIQRSHLSNACPSMFAFPGGFVDSNALKDEPFRDDVETTMDAAIRELQEETNLILPRDSKLILIGEYVGGGRDPRDNEISWSKTTAYFYQIDLKTFQDQKNNIRGMDDAIDTMWVDLDQATKMNLAFDHNQILNDLLNFLKMR